MGYYVCVLQSLKDHHQYIGFTTDVEGCLRYHNAGLQRSTRHRILFRLVLFEEFETKEALRRQYQYIKAISLKVSCNNDELLLSIKSTHWVPYQRKRTMLLITDIQDMMVSFILLLATNSDLYRFYF